MILHKLIITLPRGIGDILLLILEPAAGINGAAPDFQPVETPAGTTQETPAIYNIAGRRVKAPISPVSTT